MPALISLFAVLGLSAAGLLLAWWSGGPSGRPYDLATPLRILALTMAVLLLVGSLALAAVGHVRGPLLVGGAILALGVGGWVGARWWGRPGAIPADVAPGPVRWRMLMLVVVVGLVALASIVVVSGIPLLTRDPQASRSAFAGLTFDLFRWLVPPAALVVLGWALARPTRRRLAGAAVALGAVVTLEVLLASRALPFELGAAALLIIWWSGRRLRREAWVGLAAGAFVLFIGVLFARMDSSRSFRDPLDVMQFVMDRTIGRVVLIQARTVDVAVETIPDLEPYWNGATYVRRLGRLLGDETDHPALGAWLYARLFPGAPPAFAAPGVLTEGWVNAGAPLALGLMLLLGLAAQGFGRLLDRLGSSPVDRAAAALLVVALARTYATSLNGLLLTIAITLAWWLLVRPGSFGAARATLRSAVERRASWRPRTDRAPTAQA